MTDRRGLLALLAGAAAGSALLTQAHAGAVWKLATVYRAESFHGKNLDDYQGSTE